MEGPTPMFEDTEGCEALATNAITISAKTKHFVIRHHFVVRSRLINQVQGSGDSLDLYLGDDFRYPH